ncbi:MAG: prolyl oligopeptidase family serine peptidase [Bryobacteraceae bacterium]|nr:prolyl oligopeptidase family serine peptidase [Bryobacteraceae bacterium]
MFQRSAALFLCVLMMPLPQQAAGKKTPPARKRASPELTVDFIMRGPDLYGWAPKDVRWSGDSLRVYFQWKRHDDALNADYSTYVVNRDGTGLKKLSDEQARLEAPPLESDDTRDWKISLFADKGDIYLHDRMAGRTHRLSKTLEKESSARFTHDEERIAFVRGNNLFVVVPANGALEQLTDIRTGDPRQADPDKKGTPSQEFLKKEEQTLLEAIRERALKREQDEEKKKNEDPRKPFFLTARQSVSSLLLAPDETYILAVIEEEKEAAKKTLVPNFVTEAGYTAGIDSRAKVGDEQSLKRIGFLDAKTGEMKWLSHDIKDRDIRFLDPKWSDDGKKLVLWGRAADNKDAWIFTVDPSLATAKPLVQMHDDAWVGGPVDAREAFGWVPGTPQVYFTWERDGWSHLYTVNANGGEPKQLTEGKWEVRDVRLSPDRTKFLLTTSETHPGEDHLYEMDFDGGERRRLTAMPGGHKAEVSPDGTMIATVHSYTNRPPELYLQDLRDSAAKPIQATSSPAPDFWKYPWLDVPTVDIPARDGARVPARMYKPPKWRKGGPLVVFVHGAGYLQNVHHRWSQYAREYMFHHLLMDRGYMVLDLDYRASAGYGRDWRTAIYQRMGGKDLDDQVDAVKWAIREHGVNPKRVGIYGGSYGGFITLMAMFTKPDVFQAGASLRPVTDWAHYNHGYTSNILNTPQADEKAYKLSSPIYHANGLKGALLICHGMVDTNVHFQDTVRLVQRLIELRKENWDLAVYPVEDHAFLNPVSWADEYRRILRLFETNLRSR